uniref:Uncharacterized protein n=1 Tax=Onchocerca volvulus TaxID=6282 RepID=A0A8R1TQF7_ONCVO
MQANDKVGPYIFRLEVIDNKQQNDSATVDILVNRAINSAPIPYAGGNQTFQLPIESVVLDGNVKDDGQIVSYNWFQIRQYLMFISETTDYPKNKYKNIEMRYEKL